MPVVAMPVKTVPVLFVTFIFLITGASISSLLVDKITTSLIIFAVGSHLFTLAMWYSIFKNHKKQTPIFGLSIILWILVTFIGYGIGVSLLFIA